MIRVSNPVFAALMVSLVTACGSSGPGTSNETQIDAVLDRLDVERANVVNSVANFRITGWQAINNRNLIVTAGLHNHYLITLAAPCFDLDFAFNIGVDTRSVALSRGDYIVPNSLHRPLERCQIAEITRLVDREEATE